MTAESLVERTQVELDALYGGLAARAGHPTIDTLIAILRTTDDTLAQLRTIALAIDAERARSDR